MQTPWGDLAVSDAHVHFFSRRFFNALGAQCSTSAEQVTDKLVWRLPADDPAELATTWVKELDSHGVARAALIASIPGDEASVSEAKAAFPERFWAYAMVNPMADNAAVAAGLDAVCLFPAMHRYAMHDPEVATLLDQAQANGCAVFVHCGVLSSVNRPIVTSPRNTAKPFKNKSIGRLTRCAARRGGVRKNLGLNSPYDMRFSNPLDLHAVALRYPQVRFVIPHFGAGYFREALMLADLCPNVYLDTSSSNSWMRYEGLDLKAVFRRALDVAGAGRLLFGTDSSFFPRGWVAGVFEQQALALTDVGISESDARQIFGGNLAGILKKS